MIHVLTGPVHSGKTTWLREVVGALRERGVSVDGFLCERVVKDGESAGYDLHPLGAGRPVPFLRRGGDEGRPRAGPYGVLPAGLAAGERIIERGREADLLVVDEVGPLEMRGGGFWPALERVLPSARCLVVVRESVLEEFLERVAPREVAVHGRGDLRLLEAVAGGGRGGGDG